VDGVLAGVGLAQRTRLIEEPWGANVLASHLLSGGHALDLVAVHADHFTYGTPAEPMLVEAACLTQEVPTGALIYAVACHAGLSVPGGDCASGLVPPVGETPQSLDWPQVWIGQGSTYVASTAWAYGGTTELAYLEELLTLLTEELVAGGSTTVGEAAGGGQWRRRAVSARAQRRWEGSR